jgi:tetratricopeptide (TPR) repeat protein
MPGNEQDLVSLYREWQRCDRAGAYAEAHAIAQEIRRIPGDSELTLLVAKACEDVATLKLNLWTELEADVREQLTADPRSAAAWTERASALVALDRFDEALSSARNAIEYDPRSECAWRCFGIATAESQPTQSLTLALEYFDKAISLNPQSEWAWFHKGMALSDAGRHGEALDCFRHIIDQLNSGNEWAWYCRGLTFENLGRAADADQSYAKAQSLASIGRIT